VYEEWIGGRGKGQRGQVGTMLKAIAKGQRRNNDR
jgi:hypothetical protein